MKMERNGHFKDKKCLYIDLINKHENVNKKTQTCYL